MPRGADARAAAVSAGGDEGGTVPLVGAELGGVAARDVPADDAAVAVRGGEESAWRCHVGESC